MRKFTILLLFTIFLNIMEVDSKDILQAAPLQQGEDYIVQTDDWLSKLSDKFLGDILAYPAITHYTNQKNVTDVSYTQIFNSDLIEVGQKIYIPTAEEAEAYFIEAAGERVSSGTIKIGAIMPLSAPGSVRGGTAMKAALEIAVAEINAGGGVLGQPVELMVVDTEGLPERGAIAMQRLINQEGVVGVVGEYHSAVGLSAKQVAVENNIPIIFAETWNDRITSEQQPQVFRIAPLSSEVATVDAKFIASLGADYVVIMTENTGYGLPAAEATTNRLSEAGIDSETFFADIGTVDFAPIIERIKAGPPPDVILVLLTGETSFNFEQQAAEAGIGPQDVTMICNQAAADSAAFWSAVPDGELCIYRRIGLPRPLWTAHTRAFAEQYAAATGKAEPESFAMEAYDSLRLMAQGINEANSTEPEAIITALENISYDGVLGTITFPYGQSNPIPDGVATKWWHQFPDPAITLVQYTKPGQDAAEATVIFPNTYKTGDVVRP